MTKVTLLIVALLALMSAAAVASNETLESLKARAADAEGSKQVELFAEVAERQLEQVAKAYEAGNDEKAQQALRDVLEYGLKAADTSRATGKRMKKTEITIRKIANRLEDISRSLAFDERPPVKQAIEKLENARTALLHTMFTK